MELLKDIKSIVVHHSQRDKDSMEFIKVRHKQNQGWEDIGYHYVIEKSGELKKARSEKYMGAHVYGHNKNSIGVCPAGNLDEKPLTEKQIKTLIKFLKKKMKKHKIPVKNILGHREFPGVKKTCPGKFIDMNELRNMIQPKS